MGDIEAAYLQGIEVDRIEVEIQMHRPPTTRVKRPAMKISSKTGESIHNASQGIRHQGLKNALQRLAQRKKQE